jgi:ketosteroid isomerase-like protein
MTYRLAVLLWAAGTCCAQSDADRIKTQVARYAASVDAADVRLAAQVWDTAGDISFIHPMGEAHGWKEVQSFLTDIMGGMFSERKLTPGELHVRVYGDAAWCEFHWKFAATQKDGTKYASEGRETQIYRRMGGKWALVHVHYSAMPQAGRGGD